MHIQFGGLESAPNEPHCPRWQVNVGPGSYTPHNKVDHMPVNYKEAAKKMMLEGQKQHIRNLAMIDSIHKCAKNPR